MINSVIILILILLLSFEHAKLLENTRNASKNKQRTKKKKKKKKKREKHSHDENTPNTKISHHQTVPRVSCLLLSFVLLSLFLNATSKFLDKKQRKSIIDCSSFPHIAFSRANRENSCLRVVVLSHHDQEEDHTSVNKKNERRIITSSLKSCLPRE